MSKMKNTDILYKVGSNIRKWRQVKGFKQDSLANEVEISKVSISKMETGKTEIPLTRLYSISKALQINIELLFIDPFEAIEIGGGSKSFGLNINKLTVN